MLRHKSSYKVRTIGYINYIKIYVILGNIKLAESIFGVIHAKISFLGLTPVQISDPHCIVGSELVDARLNGTELYLE